MDKLISDSLNTEQGRAGQGGVDARAADMTPERELLREVLAAAPSPDNNEEKEK